MLVAQRTQTTLSSTLCVTARERTRSGRRSLPFAVLGERAMMGRRVASRAFSRAPAIGARGAVTRIGGVGEGTDVGRGPVAANVAAAGPAAADAIRVLCSHRHARERPGEAGPRAPGVA